MASLSTSARVPAYRSATARARSKISGVSTGSGDMTRSRRASLPWCSLVWTRDSKYPSTSCPANLTRTRQPGTAASSRAAGTR